MKKCILTMLLMTSLLFTSCTNKNPANSFQNSTNQNNKKEKVSVILDWVPNTNHTGMYIALEKGYYSDEGLDVTINQPAEETAVLMLSSGKADFGISFQEEIATARSAEVPQPIIAVASIIQHNTSGILSLKKTGINSPKDMENKRYATWDAPVEKAVLNDIISKDGGDFSKVKMIPSSVTDIISALNTNIDAVWVFYAWDGIATKVKGLDTNYIAFKDINPVFDFYTPVLAANENYLKNNPETAKKFLKATARGYEYAISNPEEAAKILVKYAPETDLQIATESQKYLATQYKAEVKRWGYIDNQRWQSFYDWMYEKKLLNEPLKQGFTNDYLPE